MTITAWVYAYFMNVPARSARRPNRPLFFSTSTGVLQGGAVHVRMSTKGPSDVLYGRKRQPSGDGKYRRRENR